MVGDTAGRDAESWLESSQNGGRDESSGFSGSFTTSRLSRRERPGFTTQLTGPSSVYGKHSPFEHHFLIETTWPLSKLEYTLVRMLDESASKLLVL
ncbi:hypothetical protein K0M31_001184 [Melipona bicolor]|uniref:Uncharacterized protein n=1 Tax=Melipona bicolor TaxID=60889 RepID=A0AA40KXE6_9HYME|nr:hypothetical protein K0M31_001184 [Melipona bicolor]